MQNKWLEVLESRWMNPGVAALDWKEKTGGKIIAGTLPDLPEEMIQAAGALPQYLLGRDIPFLHAEGHLQNFACSYTRTILEMLHAGELDYLDGIIIPHACDATRCMDLVIKEVKLFPFSETFYIPKYSASPSAKSFFREELNRIRSRLADLTGQYPDVELIRESINLHNRVRALLSEVMELLKGNPPLVSAAEYFAAVRAAMVMPKEYMKGKLEEFLAEARTRMPEADTRPPVILAGKVPEPSSIINMIEESGLRIIEDTLVIGARYVLAKASLDIEPIEALIERQLNQIPFTGIWDTRPSRASYIIERVRETKARGVLILVQKFCEPYEVEAPGIRMELEKQDIPCIFLESDYKENSLEPLRTRVQAFAEMLKE
jgi:bcr-type benzoyl-CoA reductase subunit C